MDYPINIPLWPHQQNAVQVIAEFLDRKKGRRATQPLASLVNIPTGGGKTAVIGTLAHWHATAGNILVLAPRKAIRRQLAAELAAKRGFFLRSGYHESTLPKRVVELSAGSDIPARFGIATIFVSTIQLIAELTRDKSAVSSYRRLGQAVQVVFVDEGHYEPALQWSEAIRGLNLPTVLVTATPYRNDLKSFDIDWDAVHVASYTNLAKDNYLRAVDVVQADPKHKDSPAKFVDSVLKAFFNQYHQAPSAERKLIIRCQAREQIRQLGNRIRAHELGHGGVLCLHETFGEGGHETWEQKQPSDPELPGAPAIWIHQHKLLEGVDGPSFRAVAIYGSLGSARALVQQIGRIVRNPGRELLERSLVIDHSGGALQRMWERFKEYDSGISGTRMQSSWSEFEAAIQLPAIVYADRQFRKRLTFSNSLDGGLLESLRLPLRCHLYEVHRTGSLENLREATRSRMLEADRPFKVLLSTPDELVILFAKLETSPLLAEHYFWEPELHVLVARRRGLAVVVLDTSRPGLDEDGSISLGWPVNRKTLARLLHGSKHMRLTEVSTRSTALGASMLRRRSLVASSLGGTPPSLDEFQFVASSITAADRQIFGHSGEDRFHNRSIGFSSARVSETARRLDFDAWRSWTDRLIDAAAKASAKSPEYLERYAQPYDGVPQRTEPRNILLDIEEARDFFVLESEEDETDDAQILEIEDTCVDCIKDKQDPTGPRQLVINANGKKCAATLEYLPVHGVYDLKSDELEARYRYRDGSLSGGLVRYLNSQQSFTVIPEEKNLIYTERGFYKPGLHTGRSFDPSALGLDDMLEEHAGLRLCTSEKGKENSAKPQGWADHSVFQWIDENPNLLLQGAELIICDDGTHESCDFLLAGRQNGRDAVMIVHAKRPQTASKVAAGSIHDVCSQATKHVGTLSLFRPLKPAQVASWGGPWKGSRKEGTVSNRIRRCKGRWVGLTPNGIWHQLESMLERHSTERHVVLVLGAALMAEEFFAQARKEKATSNSIHVLHLIRSTLAGVVGAGAKLRILCG